MLLPKRLVRHDGPSTLQASLLHQPEKKRVALHLLCYVPVRKSATIDIVEERTTLRDISFEVTIPFAVSHVRAVPNGRELPCDDGRFTVPEIDGYCILELCYE